MTGIRVIESNDSKLELLLGTDLFSLHGTNFCKVATNNEGGCCPITIEAGPKGSRELFTLALIIYEVYATTSGRATETANIIKEVSGPELALMPVFLGWTVAKQCLTNPCEIGDLKAWHKKGT